MESTTTTTSDGPGAGLWSAAVAVLIFGLIAAVGLGFLIGATSTGDGAVQMLEQPTHGLDKQFNWLITILVGGFVIVTSAVLAAAAAVVDKLSA